MSAKSICEMCDSVQVLTQCTHCKSDLSVLDAIKLVGIRVITCPSCNMPLSIATKCVTNHKGRRLRKLMILGKALDLDD